MALYSIVAMPNVMDIGPYHIAIYSSIKKNHSIFSFKLMQGNREIATYNMNKKEWQSIKDKQDLDKVISEIENWLELPVVKRQLKRRMYDALYCRPIKVMHMPISKKELLHYLKEQEKLKELAKQRKENRENREKNKNRKKELRISL